MNNFKPSNDSLDIPWIESPFFNQLLEKSDYVIHVFRKNFSPKRVVNYVLDYKEKYKPKNIGYIITDDSKPDKFIDKLWKSPIVEDIIEFCKMKESIDLAKTTDGKKKNKIYVPKLEDALWAGTAKSEQCSLILTEGLSAMTFALWGRSIVGPERWGVFPLKGKVLNIRDASISQLMNNEEINNLKQRCLIS